VLSELQICVLLSNTIRVAGGRAPLSLLHTRNTLSPGSEAYTYHHWQKAICLHDLVHHPRANATVATQLLVRPAVIVGNQQNQIILNLNAMKLSKLKHFDSDIIYFSIFLEFLTKYYYYLSLKCCLGSIKSNTFSHL
jgi:hypothetical protein